MSDSRKISIYFDKELVKNRQNYIQLLYPFLGIRKKRRILSIKGDLRNTSSRVKSIST